jgi:hypothetical protein
MGGREMIIRIENTLLVGLGVEEELGDDIERVWASNIIYTTSSATAIFFFFHPPRTTVRFIGGATQCSEFEDILSIVGVKLG